MPRRSLPRFLAYVWPYWGLIARATGCGMLEVVYAVWAVALYYRSQWSQLAGHRVMMDLRSDLYRHIHTLSRSRASSWRTRAC